MAVVFGKQYTQGVTADNLVAQFKKTMKSCQSTGDFLTQVWEYFYFELANSCHKLSVDFQFEYFTFDISCRRYKFKYNAIINRPGEAGAVLLPPS